MRTHVRSIVAQLSSLRWGAAGMPPPRGARVPSDIRVVRSLGRDVIGDSPIKQRVLHRGVAHQGGGLAGLAADICAHWGRVPRRAGQTPEAVGQAGPAVSQAGLLDDDLGEAHVKPQTLCRPLQPMLQDSSPSQDIFDGPNVYEDHTRVRASELALKKYIKQAPRRRPVRKQMTGVWLQKLSAKSPSPSSTLAAVSQDGGTYVRTYEVA